MKKFTTCALLAAGMFAGTSHASGIQVEGIRLLRQGQTQEQGQIEIQVNRGAQAQELVVTTLSCNQRELNAGQQQATRIQLAGQVAQEALVILENQARLASEQSIIAPLQGEAGQSQQNELSVDYQYQYGVEIQQARRVIQAPIVIIGSQVSGVLEQIEQQARVASQETCRQ